MIEMYGTNDCVLCGKAKELLQKANKDYTYIDISETEDTTAAFFKKFPDVKTVPQVSLSDGHWIGGYQELVIWLNHSE